MGKTDKCILWADKILHLKPKDPALIALKTGAFEDEGRVDDAETVLLPLIRKAGGNLSQLSVSIRDVWGQVTRADIAACEIIPHGSRSD